MSLELMGKVKACAEAVPSAERSIVATRLLGTSVCLSVYLHLQVTCYIKPRLAIRPRHHEHCHLVLIVLSIRFSFITLREGSSDYHSNNATFTGYSLLPPPNNIMCQIRKNNKYCHSLECVYVWSEMEIPPFVSAQTFSLNLLK